MNLSAPSLGYFKRTLRAHLERALTLIPDRVPHDVFDESAGPLMDELQQLETFLYGLGYDERKQEDRESRREGRIEAKRRIPVVEEIVMKVDHHVQEAMAILGTDPRQEWVLLPMHADMTVNVFVQFLDCFPPEAFAANRLIPSGFPSTRDETVAAIIRLMRERKSPPALRSEMNTNVFVMLCTNDPDNGSFTGRVCRADFQIDGEIVLSLETGFWYERDNPTCGFPESYKLRVGRRVFTIRGWSDWVGNWCWRGMNMHHDEAKRLAAHLLSRGFTKDMWVDGCDLLPDVAVSVPNAL